MKDTVKTQGSHASRGRQSPDDVSVFIDKALCRQDRRNFERRLLKHAGSDLRMDIHHRQDGRRWLPHVERDIEAVTDKHFLYFPSVRRRGTPVISKSINPLFVPPASSLR